MTPCKERRIEARRASRRGRSIRECLKARTPELEGGNKKTQLARMANRG